MDHLNATKNMQSLVSSINNSAHYMITMDFVKRGGEDVNPKLRCQDKWNRLAWWTLIHNQSIFYKN